MSYEDAPVVILLDTPETTEDVTHKKVVNWTIEVPRTDNKMGKEGWARIWVAPCYSDGEIWYEDPKMLGEEFLIDKKNEFEDLMEVMMLATENFLEGCLRVISQFLIDKDYIDGTVIID